MEPADSERGLDGVIRKLNERHASAEFVHPNAEQMAPLDSDNPFATGLIDQPARWQGRRLSLSEWIGTLIGASIAGVTVFFATCGGGGVILGTINDRLGVDYVDGGLGLALLICCLFLLPSIAGVMTFFAIIRAAKK